MTTPAPQHTDLSGPSRATTWSTVAAAIAGVGGLVCLALGVTGRGSTATPEYPTSSLTHALPHDVVAVGTGIVGLTVAAGLLAMRSLTRSQAAGMTSGRVVLLVGTPVLAALTLGAVADAGLLAIVGYLPMVVLSVFGSSEARDAFAQLPWGPTIAQALVGMVTAATVVAAIRAADSLRGSSPRPAWQRPQQAARWGTIAVVVAVLVPVLYAFTRIVWALGWPLGFDMDAYTASGGDVTNGLFLAAGALVGAILTVGLVRPWGERFWTWVPGLGGRPVPVALAVVPATAVAVMLLPAGVSMIVSTFSGLAVASIGELSENWAAFGVTFLWPLWSLALGAATWAYALRRQGSCTPA